MCDFQGIPRYMGSQASRGPTRTRRLQGFWIAALLACGVELSARPVLAAGESAAAQELSTFKTWLEREHPGYGCDEGPAPFRNSTVDGAYPSRRFYYVLTYARGIAPPFPNSLSMVVQVSENGEVRRLDASDPASFQPGLMKVASAQSARQAAAAILILALGDPGERRWRVDVDSMAVKKSRKGWVGTYYHGGQTYASRVTFDRSGVLTSIQCNPPPVP